MVTENFLPNGEYTYKTKVSGVGKVGITTFPTPLHCIRALNAKVWGIYFLNFWRLLWQNGGDLKPHRCIRKDAE